MDICAILPFLSFIVLTYPLAEPANDATHSAIQSFITVRFCIFLLPLNYLLQVVFAAGNNIMQIMPVCNTFLIVLCYNKLDKLDFYAENR